MSLEEETVRFGDSKQYVGFFAVESRAKRPLPSVVVLQEAWGVDDHIEDVTRRFARAGYAALAPDLFAVDGKRPDAMSRERLAEFLQVADSTPGMPFFDSSKRDAALAALPDGQRQRVSETLGALFAAFGAGMDTHLPALLAATQYLRVQNEITRGRKIGSVGYCMGGGLSGLLAAHDPQLAVACIFYGTVPGELAPKIACPVYGFYGADDARINATVPPFAEAMKAAGKHFEEHTYAGAGHAFSNDNRPTYDVDATRDAFARVLEAFRDHLV